KNRVRNPVRLPIPLAPELAHIIAATPGTSITLTFITTDRGTPYSAEGFGNVFRRWCADAGLPHCSAHGLRKAAASQLAELGATVHEIAAITGHRSLKEVQRYTRGAEQKKLAAAAFNRLAADKTGAKKSHPDAATPEWDENDPQPIEKKGPVSWMVPR